MKLHALALCCAVGILGSTASAQFTSTRPASPKATPQVKQQPTKAPAIKLQLPGGPQIAPSTGGQTLVASGVDDCAGGPQAIAGPGPHAVTNVGATTGAQGQGEAACLFFGQMGITNDVWFTWTAPANGTFRISMCAFTAGIDPKIAVYDGSTCPGAAAIACNDDTCGLVTEVDFTAVSGQSYVFQFGNFPGAAQYTSSFTVMPPPGPPANDSCTTPTALGAGTGSFPISTVAATTGVEGQSEGACIFFGSMAVFQDTWYTWTATSTDTYTLSLCGGVAGVDSKLHVYPSGGCPVAGSVIACNDDTCGLISEVTFGATNGTTYLLQLGTFSAAGATYSGTLDISVAPPASPDDCTLAAPIAGPGPHGVNTATATTGVEGQTEALCNFFGSTVIDNDAWFTWPATINGIATLSMCGGVTGDPKVAIYSGAGCPAPGTAIACNDDSCGLVSEVSWVTTAGSTYLIQAGSFPGAAGYVGTFTITESVPPPNDDCSMPSLLAGPGPYAFDNSSASTGAQGQAEAACLFFGSTVIDRDVWYTWVAPSTGSFELSTVGQTGVDTKVAVYDGVGCPVGAALACNDDACGTLQTGLAFNATAGQSYTIQLGTFPGAAGGVGTFSINAAAGAGGCQYDDGTSEDAIGLVAGGEVAWLHRVGEIGGSTTISTVMTAYGTPAFPGGTPPAGTVTQVCVWDDPNDDGDPTDAVLLVQTASTVQNPDTDMFSSTVLPMSVTFNGYGFIGIGLVHAPGQFVAPLDQSSCTLEDLAWAVGSTAGAMNYMNLAANNVPPVALNAIGFPGVWLLRADCNAGPGAGFCAGDGLDPQVTLPCPCGNFGAQGNGCAWSNGPNGANLTATGSVANDDAVLQGSGMPATVSGIYLRAYTADPTGGTLPFHDGISCLTGAILRMRTVANVGGASSFPDSTETITLQARACAGAPNFGVCPPGTTTFFTLFYRNAAAAFCPPATANATNGYVILW